MAVFEILIWGYFALLRTILHIGSNMSFATIIVLKKWLFENSVVTMRNEYSTGAVLA